MLPEEKIHSKIQEWMARPIKLLNLGNVFKAPNPSEGEDVNLKCLGIEFSCCSSDFVICLDFISTWSKNQRLFIYKLSTAQPQLKEFIYM
jgi:hypothetical protein